MLREKDTGLFHRRGQAAEVVREAADEGVGIGGTVQGKFFADALGIEEPVDGMVGPTFPHRGNFGTRRFLEGPMFLILPPLVDPAFHQGDFLGRKARLVRLRRRHHFLGILADEPGDQFARGVVAGLHCLIPAEVAGRGGKGVEPEIGLLHFLVKSVTFETAVTEKRPDLALEIDFLGGKKRRDQGERTEEPMGEKAHGRTCTHLTDLSSGGKT